MKVNICNQRLVDLKKKKKEMYLDMYFNTYADAFKYIKVTGSN